MFHEKIGIWNGGSGPGSDCHEHLLGQEFWNEIFLLRKDPIIVDDKADMQIVVDPSGLLRPYACFISCLLGTPDIHLCFVFFGLGTVKSNIRKIKICVKVIIKSSFVITTRS